MAETAGPAAISSEAAGPDVIDQLAGIAPGSALARLRAERPEVRRHAQGSEQALLMPEDPGGVSRYEREAIALRAALLAPSLPLVARHRSRLRELGADAAALAAVEHFPEGGALPPRLAAMLRFTDRLTREPGAAEAAHIAELKAAGLAPRDIVTVAQLVALLSFQVRLLAGLKSLEEGA